jgi:hypothetical protein
MVIYISIQLKITIMYLNKIRFILSSAMFTLLLAGCQKMDRPALDPNFPTDENQVTLPGNLRFFASFNGTDGPSPRWNASDSISGNPALLFPLSYEPGVTGNALVGKDGTSALYLNANDFKNATDFSIAFWIKSAAHVGRTEFIFSMVQPGFSWHQSALFILVENQTASNVTMKVGVKDQWLEGNFPKPMFDNNWHHIVYSFNNTAKKMTYYFDGVEVLGLANNQYNVANPVSFADIKNLVIGGWNRHAQQPGPTDDWVKSFTGTIDQFRLYNKPLSASEAMALFTTKQ